MYCLLNFVFTAKSAMEILEYRIFMWSTCILNAPLFHLFIFVHILTHYDQ